MRICALPDMHLAKLQTQKAWELHLLLLHKTTGTVPRSPMPNQTPGETEYCASLEKYRPQLEALLALAHLHHLYSCLICPDRLFNALSHTFTHRFPSLNVVVDVDTLLTQPNPRHRSLQVAGGRHENLAQPGTFGAAVKITERHGCNRKMQRGVDASAGHPDHIECEHA
eukprot:1161035-Pelagomonas_calceolata.AAC.5